LNYRCVASNRPEEAIVFRPFRRVAYFVAAAFFASTAPASAGTIYDLNATSLSAALSNFAIRFDDSSADGLLQFNEITNFSGLQFGGNTLTDVICVPTIAAASTLSGACGGVTGSWIFGNPGILIMGTGNFSYSLSPVSAVPLPPALPLLAFGIGVIGLLRWWRARRTPALRMAA
jgi:hypothetical protein